MSAYIETPADAAFTAFLDGFDVAAFTEIEFRMYQAARRRRLK